MSLLELIARALVVLASVSPGDVVLSDTATEADPTRIWGRIDCDWHPEDAVPGHLLVPSGGDPHTTSGLPPTDDSFRRLTVYDGDDIAGERCELGLNDHRRGPTALFHEGERYLTRASIRLPADIRLGSPRWRVVMQMKQAQPYNNTGGGSMLELQVRDGRWLLISDWRDLWSAPALPGVWTRFAFDVTYSQNDQEGSVQVQADLNGDGDPDDDVDGDGRRDERSPVIRVDTLRRETAGSIESGLRPGESIPSHLRLGLYQDPALPCPGVGGGCSVDVDNVQVVRR